MPNVRKGGALVCSSGSEIRRGAIKGVRHDERSMTPLIRFVSVVVCGCEHCGVELFGVVAYAYLRSMQISEMGDVMETKCTDVHMYAKC